MMAHPLYHQASRLVGQPVYVHHVSGTLHHGTLVSVQPHGVYVMPHPVGTRLVASEGQTLDATLTPNTTASLEAELVYGPAAFFGFGALTGLTAAAMFSPYWW